MADVSLTPEEFELHLKDLQERLAAYLERGEGSSRELFKLAEQVLALRDDFPAIYERYPEVEGLVAEMLARRNQEKFVATAAPAKAPGCTLGWLFGGKKR